VKIAETDDVQPGQSKEVGSYRKEVCRQMPTWNWAVLPSMTHAPIHPSTARICDECIAV